MIKILMLAESESANTANWMDSLSKFGKAHISLWSLPKGSSLMRLLYIPFAILAVKKKIKELKPDIVIGYRTTSYGFIGAMSGFRPLVLAAQGESDVWPPGHWSNVVSAKMARYAIKRASLLHAWGKNMVPALKSLGASEDQLLIMPRGIDTNQFTFKQPFNNPNQLTLIVSRSLYPEYNHNLLLQAFANVVQSFSEIRCSLIVAGDGPLMSILADQSKELGISEQVKFTGKVSTGVLSKHLEESDVYVSFPNTEGVSASLFEAMASGCFPIVTDLAANREFIESGKNGYLVSLNTEAIENAIIATWKDRESIKNVVSKNFEFVESYANTRLNSPKFVTAYNKLLR